MEKVKMASQMLDDLRTEIATIKAVSCTLEESMANDTGKINDEYTMLLYGLRDKLNAFAEKYMELVALLLEGMGSVKA